MYYYFYDPQKKDKIIAMSTDPNSLEFPYSELDNYIPNLENIELDKDKKIRFKKGTIDDEDFKPKSKFGVIRWRGHN